MNRLQKKCLIASAALHGLLLLVLVFGAALMPEDKAAPVTRITFFDPSKVTDGPTQGGGSPQPDQAQPPMTPITPPQPLVSLPPQPPRQNTSQFTPAPMKDADSSFKPVKPKPAQTDEFTPVDHPPVKPVASNNAAADAKAKAIADNQRRLANEIKNGIKHLSGTVGKDSAVQVDQGQESGEAAAKYRDIVARYYTAAWNPPPSLDDELATVVVSVTIARDGHVIRHEVTKSSGNAAMDKSIANTLENVTEIEPFPEGSRDAERTYSIKFNLSAKRSLG